MKAEPKAGTGCFGWRAVPLQSVQDANEEEALMLGMEELEPMLLRNAIGC
jgi:hypothetical protein